MTTTAELRERAAGLLGEPVEAAGIFSAGSAIAASIAGAAGGTTVSEIAMHDAGEIVVDEVAESAGGAVVSGAVEAASVIAGMHVAREVAAAGEGLTPVLLVAVTRTRIALMDWTGNSASGTGPTRILAEFPREATHVTFDRIGVNRKVTLDDGRSVASITGALGWLSSGKEGKRDVLRALGGTDL